MEYKNDNLLNMPDELKPKDVKKPYVSGLYSDSGAPIFYYFIIKNTSKTFLINDFLKELEQFCKTSGYKLFNNLKFFEDGDKYYQTIKLMRLVKNEVNDSGYNISWFEIPHTFVRSQEVLNGNSSYISLYVNPQLKFETVSDCLNQFAIHYSKKIKGSVEVVFRINGPDRNRKNMIERILEGLNNAYHTEHTKIQEFSDKQIDDYFTTYYIGDFQYKIESEVGYSSCNKNLKNHQLQEYSHDVQKTMMAHKDILSAGEVPCMMKILNAKYDSGLVYKEPLYVSRPSPVVELDIDYIDDIKKTEFIRSISDEFFKINKLHSKELEIKEIQKLDKEINEKNIKHDVSSLEKMKTQLIDNLKVYADNDIEGRYSEIFFEMDEVK